ncbi:MAG: hypothetical protein JNK81_08025 [Anaerolineales bacterium]|nr:hypothetical protein [Anaerolineales bacterium]
MRKNFILFTIFLVLLSIFPQGVALADAAPPEAPPGTTLLPGESITQVRMVFETVTLTISKHPSNPQRAMAKTEAIFTMRNLGATEEKMAVRFPLSFFNGDSDGYGNFPEINSIIVKVDGKIVSTRREIQPHSYSQRSYNEREEIPWAVFDVTFPPNQDVMIEVIYDVYGYGYYPYEAFKYILETGAGWNGTIGKAEIIVRLPYEVSAQNFDVNSQAGYGATSPGGVRSGNEIRWTFTELEPTYLDNIQIVVVTPFLWEKILKEKEYVQKNPNDGEAWGRLAKLYKEVVMMPKGWLRNDPAGEEVYELSKDAYEKCLALLPKDSLWHYGYADLLWAHYYYGIYSSGQEDIEDILTKTLTALQTTLTLDANNQQAKDLLRDISYQLPQAVQRGENETFILLGLTATPIPPTPVPVQPTLTFVPSPVPVTPTSSSVEETNTPEPVSTSNPLCGSAFLLPALLGILFVARKRNL